jgi:hypothetical protein
MKPDTEKGWNFIKEAVYKAASLFKKETQTRKKPWFDDEYRDIIKKRSQARQERFRTQCLRMWKNFRDSEK